jgi:murein DD-endopeptidase MepM/ murein hydrolase activator NlpD
LAESDGAVMEQEILGFSTVSPLKGTLTSGFGPREDPNTGLEAMHYGVDIAAQEGAEVCAFADGTVSVVGESTVLGKYLTVQHPGGYETLYAHCSAVTAKSGQSIAMGEVIAAVGQTGNATGPHLHFELHRDDDFLNPVYYFTDEA